MAAKSDIVITNSDEVTAICSEWLMNVSDS